MKPNKSNTWSANRLPPVLAPHSEAKHRALSGYLRRYVAAYTQNFRVRRLNLTIVEGFAGGNLYLDATTGEQRKGSPGIILDTLREAAAELAFSRTNQFDLKDRYYFIEKNWEAFLLLKKTLEDSAHSNRVGGDVQLIHDAFENCLERIIREIKQASLKGRSLFILDQCGYKDVPFNVISRILRDLPNAEVILTFAFDWLANYVSEGMNTDSLQKRTGIDFEALKQVDKTDRRWRFVMQKIFSDDMARKTGAKFYTPFFIRSLAAHRDLWLVHLAQHAKARDEMAELHWDLGTAYHCGFSGINMFGFDVKAKNLDDIAKLPGFNFDELALRDSIESLCEQLPRKIRDGGGRIVYNNLVTNIANETPATDRIIRMSLEESYRRRELLIKPQDSDTPRKSKVQEKTDIIIVPSHKSIFLPFKDEC